jgi:hypothetical protein
MKIPHDKDVLKSLFGLENPSKKEILIQKAELAEKNLWILGGFSLAIIAILLGFLFFQLNAQNIFTSS